MLDPMDESDDVEPDAPATDRAPSSAAPLDARIYGELRRIAAGYLARERADHTLQPTALVHEAWVRLSDQAPVEEAAHFRALAATAMRRILVDHARGKGTAKRGAGSERLTLSGVGTGGDAGPGSEQEGDVDVLALDAALVKLASVSPRQARVVELRFFGDLSIEEVAASLDVSPRTVNGDWRVARAWLSRELESA